MTWTKDTDPTASRLAGYLHEPVKQNMVLGALREAPGAMTNEELATITGIRTENVRRSLTRLIKKGLVERWQVPMTRRGFIGRVKDGPYLVGRTVRLTYLYQIIQQDAE